MTTTPLMNLVLPQDGGSFGVWAPILQTLFGRIDLHDHTTGLGAKIPVAGLNINADLSFSPLGTPRAITDLKAIDFSAVAASAVSSLAGAFFLSDGSGGLVNGELYWRTTSGSNVRITLGAALNVAAFAGSIGGDYVSVGALLDYDDATDTYRFRQETAAAVRQFAKLSSADIQLTEYKASGVTPVPATAVTIKSPAALAASYSMTMPAALPGSTQLVQMDNAGVLTATNTVTGLITANAGVTAAANQHVTVSGTGEYKHGDVTLAIPGCMAAATTNFSVVSGKLTSSGAGNGQIAIPLEQGQRLKSVTFQRTGNGVVNMIADVNLQTSAIAADVSQGQTTVNAVPATNASTTVTITSPVALAAGSCLYLNINANGTGLTVCTVRYTYDRP